MVRLQSSQKFLPVLSHASIFSVSIPACYPHTFSGLCKHLSQLGCELWAQCLTGYFHHVGPWVHQGVVVSGCRMNDVGCVAWSIAVVVLS
jgi:hypothetical protein